MIDSIYSSLEELGNVDIIDTVDDIVQCGTEADEQLKVEKDRGIDELLIHLMNGVEYKI